jgi:hypothetical protein
MSDGEFSLLHRKCINEGRVCELPLINNIYAKKNHKMVLSIESIIQLTLASLSVSNKKINGFTLYPT